MRQTYLRAVRYAQVIDRELYRDNVHNAWLYYFDKTGENLFEKDLPLALYWVKLMSKRSLYSGKHFVGLEDYEPVLIKTPESEYIDKESVCVIRTRVQNYVDNKVTRKPGNKILEVLYYLERGYTSPEICEMMQCSTQNYHQYIKKLRQLVGELFSSPFNGNRLKLREKITRDKYEKNIDDYKDYVYDTNRWSDRNEYYTQLTHKTENHGLLIVEGKRLDFCMIHKSKGYRSCDSTGSISIACGSLETLATIATRAYKIGNKLIEDGQHIRILYEGVVFCV